MNKYLVSFFYFIAVLFISCSVNRQMGKIIEQSGDVVIKNQKTIRKNYYIGHSQSYIDFDEALRNSIIQAQTMILNELGISISISSTEISTILGRNNDEDLSYFIERDIRLESEHDIQTRINRIYYEKVLMQNTIFYRVWVELFFDIDDFYRQFHQFWITEINNLNRTNFETMNSNFILNFERILEIKQKFDDEKKYLTNNIIRDFESLNNQFMTSFNTNHRNINVRDISNNSKFSNNFVFIIIDETITPTVMSAIPNLPVQINNVNYLTNNQGLINYTADYNRPIVLTLGHHLHRHFPTREIAIYFNDSFSPFFNRNVTLSVNSREETVRNSFHRLFERRGFRMGERFDLSIDIFPIETTQIIAPNQYLTDLKFRVDIRTSNTNYLRTIYIPSDMNETIRGHGRTEMESRTNAYNMEWFGRGEEELIKFEQVVREILTL